MQAIYYVLIGVALALLWELVQLYNRLVKYRNAADANMGQIKVALKKRLDMVEQLLGAVRGYVKHEREIFESIARLRAGVGDAGASGVNDIDRQSREIVNNLLAVAEAYPDLKASENVAKLMEAIVNVEDEIARHRYTYNNVVQEFNTMVDVFPSNMIAGAMKAAKLSYLEFEEAIQKPPEVSVKPDA
jgi:LemA protein